MQTGLQTEWCSSRGLCGTAANRLHRDKNSCLVLLHHPSVHQSQGSSEGCRVLTIITNTDWFKRGFPTTTLHTHTHTLPSTNSDSLALSEIVTHCFCQNSKCQFFNRAASTHHWGRQVKRLWCVRKRAAALIAAWRLNWKTKLKNKVCCCCDWQISNWWRESVGFNQC